MIITVFNDDKDTSRSMLATGLAVAFTNNRNAALVDASAQDYSLNWCARRNFLRAQPELTGYAGRPMKSGLNDLLSKMRRPYRNIIIDADASDSMSLEAAVLAADVLLVPIQFGSDAHANARHYERRFAQRIDGLRLFNPTLKVMAVELHLAHNGGQLPAIPSAAVRPICGAVWANTIIHQTFAEKTAYERGASALDDDARDQDAATEMLGLSREIVDLAASETGNDGVEALIHAIRQVVHPHEGGALAS